MTSVQPTTIIRVAEHLYVKNTEIKEIPVPQYVELYERIIKHHPTQICEHVKHGMLVKPYFDKDRIKSIADFGIPTNEDIKIILEETMQNVRILYPEISDPAQIVVGFRHRKVWAKDDDKILEDPKSSIKEDCYKISFRIFVRGLATQPEYIKSRIIACEQQKFWDTSVYSNGRKLMCLGTIKKGETSKNAVLRPLHPELNQGILDFTASYIEGAEILVGPAEIAVPKTIEKVSPNRRVTVPHPKSTPNILERPASEHECKVVETILELLKRKDLGAVWDGNAPTRNDSKQYCGYYFKTVEEGRKCLHTGEFHCKNNFFINAHDDGRLFYHCLATRHSGDLAFNYFGRWRELSDQEKEEIALKVVHAVMFPSKRFTHQEDPCSANRVIAGRFLEIPDHGELADDGKLYVSDFTRYLDKHKILILHAIMGGGKTYQIRAAIKYLLTLFPDLRVLIMTPRVSFAYSIYADIQDILPGLKCYKDIDGGGEERYLVCQMESLHKFDPKFDLTIIDESESCFTQICSGTMDGGLPEIYKNPVGDRRFENAVANIDKIMTHSRHVIMCDAFVSDRTLGMAREFLGPKGKAVYIKCTIPPRLQHAFSFGSEKEKGFEKFMKFLQHPDMVDKKKVCTVASRRLALKVKAILEVEVGNDGEQHPLFYQDGYSSSKEKKKLLDVVNEWLRVWNLCFNTCITVGVNFSEEWFDTLCMAFSANSGLVRDLIQSSMRVRHKKDLNMFFTWDSNYYLSTAVPIFELDVLMRDLEKRCSYYGDAAKMFKTEYPYWMKMLWALNQRERNASAIYHKTMVFEYLKLCGYTIEESTEQDRMDTPPKSAPAYDSIPVITLETYNKIEVKIKKGQENAVESLQWWKHHYSKFIIKEELLPDNILGGQANLMALWWSDYYANRQRVNDKLDNLRKELDFGDLDIGIPFINPLDEKCKLIKEITKRLGLDNSGCFGICISHSKYEAAEAWALKNKERLSKVFSLRLRGSGSCKRPGYDLLNMVLASWGYIKIVKKGRNRTTGRDTNGDKISVDISDYILRATDYYLSAGHITRLVWRNSYTCWIQETDVESVPNISQKLEPPECIF